jgi:hypothetical protein
MDDTGQGPIWGVMAEFKDPAALTHGAEKVRDAGYRKWDVYAPFPVHGMDEAMGLPPSRIGFIVGAGALLGVVGAMLMQGWMSAVDYRLVVDGKPFFAWEQFMPITFELGVLLSAFGAIFGMLALNGLPMLFHPLLKKERFLRVSDDRFMIVIESADPQFDLERTRSLLESAGGAHIEVVEE